MSTPKVDPTQRLAIFIDVDGTILADTKYVAPSTVTAIQTARANGNLVFLSTGRSPGYIPDQVLDIGFDGIVGSGGGVAVIGDEMVIVNKFAPDDKRFLFDYLDKHGIEWFAESTDNIHASTGLTQMMQPLVADHPDFEPPDYLPPEQLADDELLKVVIMSDDAPRVEKALAELGDKFHVVTGTIPLPFGATGELSPAGINKGSTITRLLAILGIPKEHSIAIGDNFNDIEMFDACGLSIAMGNSVPEIKALADEVTTDVSADGVYQALKRHLVI